MRYSDDRDLRHAAAWGAVFARKFSETFDRGERPGPGPDLDRLLHYATATAMQEADRVLLKLRQIDRVDVLLDPGVRIMAISDETLEHLAYYHERRFREALDRIDARRPGPLGENAR